LYNKFTTNGQKFATSQHLDMSRCWALVLRCGKFVVQQVVELLRARPLVVLYNMYVAGVRVVEFGPYSVYSKCPPSARAHAFSRARHWSMAASMTCCSILCQTFNRRYRRISRCQNTSMALIKIIIKLN